jgi:uncharacterized protein (DUF2252 family)
MDIKETTNNYEDWLKKQTHVVQIDLDVKHQKMSGSKVFKFLRATYYRWVQQWPELCSDLIDAPSIISVGDLHLENFGTWRDIEGRLSWGINDFDEAFTLPYTSDLVRLATSAILAHEDGDLDTDPDIACEYILKGYSDTLTHPNGLPFILAENNQKMRLMAIDSFENPKDFWAEMSDLSTANQISQEVQEILKQSLPDNQLTLRYTIRQAGLGGLGKERFVVLANWQGSYIAREAKAIVPSAVVWANQTNLTQEYYFPETIIQKAKRPQDPWFQLHKRWSVRRLSPDSVKIDLDSLKGTKDELILLKSMGCETGNVHLGSDGIVVKTIQDDLNKRGNVEWLINAAKKMAEATQQDFEQWKS